MRLPAIICILVCAAFAVRGQELFPLSQPASTLPKHTLGIRAYYEGYNESGIQRNILALRVMYGITAKLTAMLTATASNYHGRTLPVDFILHDHSGSGSASSNTPRTDIPYPYLFNGANLYLQYRLLTSDHQNEHFRIAAYAEGAYIGVPSHDAEPDLSLHTSGAGAGLRATYLKHHFAACLTGGAIVPFTYSGTSYDNYGGQYPTTIRYGNAAIYGLSLGYLLYPKHYATYNETNWNIYMELLGKSYGAARVSEQDGVVTYNIPANIDLLKAGSYVEAAPGIQCIIRSNTRIDLSVTFPVLGKSYTHLYPFYMVGIQRYFYL